MEQGQSRQAATAWPLPSCRVRARRSSGRCARSRWRLRPAAVGSPAWAGARDRAGVSATTTAALPQPQPTNDPPNPLPPTLTPGPPPPPASARRWPRSRTRTLPRQSCVLPLAEGVRPRFRRKLARRPSSLPSLTAPCSLPLVVRLSVPAPRRSDYSGLATNVYLSLAVGGPSSPCSQSFLQAGRADLASLRFPRSAYDDQASACSRSRSCARSRADAAGRQPLPASRPGGGAPLGLPRAGRRRSRAARTSARAGSSATSCVCTQPLCPGRPERAPADPHSVPPLPCGRQYQARHWAVPDAPLLPRLPLVWIWDSVRTPEASMPPLCGLDHTVHTRFLRCCRPSLPAPGRPLLCSPCLPAP